MSSVDDRIVNMKFENTQFKQGAAESQKSLQALEKTLVSTGKSDSIGKMGSSVQAVSQKFSVMQVAGVAAIATIASKATNMALSLAKSLTLDPIMQGFSEYQTNLNSVQTVISNTGEDVKVVNKYMDKLNAYSDQTIYNFSEMAKNIGTFTAAGVDLKTATSSIQGIANIAALSGSSSQQASTAMYQLSQAISAGRVGLQDWNSVVNAGMGGKIFQSALATTAVGMGEISRSAVDLGDKFTKLTVNGETFRKSISTAGGTESWLSGDVLVQTLAQLDGRFSEAALRAKGFNDQSVINNKLNKERIELAKKGIEYSKKDYEKLLETADAAYEAATVVKTLPQLMQVVKESIGSIWANSFELIMGDFEQSKELWSNVSKKITGNNGFLTKIGNSWTAALKDWANPKDGGFDGRGKLIRGFTRLSKSIQVVFGAIKGAWLDVFPPGSTNILETITLGFKQLSKWLRIGGPVGRDLRNIFGGLFAILHIGVTIIKAIASVFSGFFSALGEGTGEAKRGVTGFLGTIGEIIMAFDKWISSGDKASNVMRSFGEKIGSALQPVMAGITIISEAFASLVSGGGANIEGFGRTLEGVFGKNLPSMERFSGVISNLKARFEGLKEAFDGIKNSGGSVDAIAKSIGEMAGELVSGGIDLGKSLIDGLKSGISEYGPEVWQSIKDVAAGLIDGFKAAMGIHSPSTEMKELGMNILQGLGLGMLQNLAWVIDMMGLIGDKIKDAFSNMFSGGFDKTTALDVASLFNALFSGALLMQLNKFVFSLGKFSGIGPGLTGTFDSIQASLKSYQDSLKYKALREIAIAVALLAASILVLSYIPPDKIAIGVGAIASMMGMLVKSMTALAAINKGEMSIPVLAASMVAMSFALIQLGAAVLIFGNMDMKTMAQGMGGMALAMAILVKGVSAFGGLGAIAKGTGPAMLIIAFAINVLAAAVLAFGMMPLDVLIQGLAGMAIGITLLTASLFLLTLMPEAKVASAGFAVLILAGAMMVMAAAVATFGNMDMKTLEQGLKAVAVALGMMVVTLLILSKNALMVLVAASAMAILSIAMVSMAKAVGMFGSMDSSTIAKGFAAIAVGLLLLIGAAALAGLVAPGFSVLSFALMAVGGAMMLAGAGMFLFGTGFAIMTAAGVAGVAILVFAFEAFMALLPMIAVQVAASMVAFIETIAAMMPRIRDAFGVIFEELIGIIQDAIPVLESLFTDLIVMAIHVLENAVPQFVEMGFTIIDEFLESAANHIPNIADNVSSLITTFITELGEHINEIANAGVDLIVMFLEGMASRFDKIVNAVGDFILDVLDAIDRAVVYYSEQIRNAGLEIAWHLIDGMSGGLASNLWNAVKDNLPSKNDVLEFLNPIGKRAVEKRAPLNAAAEDAVKAANAIANTIQNTGGTVKDDVGKAIIAARVAAAKAERARIAESAAALKAEKLQEIADKKKNAKNKKIQNAAKIAQRKADKASANAQLAEEASSVADQDLTDAQAFAEADTLGKAEFKSDKAVELADRANALLAKANAEAAQARDLKKTDPKAAEKLMRQAKKDAERAKKLAIQAKNADIAADVFYKTEIENRIAQAQAVEDARIAEEAFEKSTPQQKAEILNKRAEINEAKALTARAEAAALIQKARTASDPRLALEYLDKAEEQAALAKEAADQAKSERDQAKNPGSSSTPGSGAGPIQPSKSVLEDASKAVDRYTESMEMAMELLGANQQPIQFVQNNNSPEALDPATIYRQTNNLIAAAEVKMADTP